ncbi:surfeit locus protein 6 [Varanus komodoensis]|uniref:Surfeit 6 n=1 Tax=Varanus komodoensis TaxID=61221 RepID=A0A8D2IV65_VARKO|nr:surfeit locus protein 6 [Varanus komodoensis]XP_044295730.1 surfeit locus protein 6 [Varanus komodoensis]
MESLVYKDTYLQKLAKKICTQEVHEPQKRKFGTGLRDDGPQLKKKQKLQKKSKKQHKMMGGPPNKQIAPVASQASSDKPTKSDVKKSSVTFPAACSAGKSATTAGKENGEPNTASKSAPSSFSAMNLLRQRLHEKIQEISGQGNTKDLPQAVLEKRQRRKYERERKKRRRKELRMKEKLEKKEAEKASVAPTLKNKVEKNDSKTEILFNNVEVHEEKELSKVEKKKEKRKKRKGNITPLTGKNYKQLLSRLESRKNRLEELKDKDEQKAKEMETKMKWTNVLYKAEGVKIRDDEERLKVALKRKEKRKAQRQKKWEKRTEHVVEKMQHRQDKRRKNLQKKKLAKAEKKKAKARKKGRILPEDLEKTGIK